MAACRRLDQSRVYLCADGLRTIERVIDLRAYKAELKQERENRRKGERPLTISMSLNCHFPFHLLFFEIAFRENFANLSRLRLRCAVIKRRTSTRAS